MNRPTGDWLMGQVVKKEATEVAIREEDPFVSMAERLASIPNLNAETIDRLLAAQERILDRQAEQEFSDAMARVQAALPAVVREYDNKQTNSKFAKHEAIAKAIKPIYTAEGFSITFSESESPKENHIRVVGILRHRAGYKETHHLDVPRDSAGIKGTVNKTETHAAGSTYTYGRRYLTCMIFDVATRDDDDGNAAGGKLAEVITGKQADDLAALISEVGADVKKFLRYYKIEAIGMLPASKYKDAVAALEKKRQ